MKRTDRIDGRRYLEINTVWPRVVALTRVFREILDLIDRLIDLQEFGWVHIFTGCSVST
jgi:hypothetical protein